MMQYQRYQSSSYQARQPQVAPSAASQPDVASPEVSGPEERGRWTQQAEVVRPRPRLSRPSKSRLPAAEVTEIVDCVVAARAAGIRTEKLRKSLEIEPRQWRDFERSPLKRAELEKELQTRAVDRQAVQVAHREIRTGLETADLRANTATGVVRSRWKHEPEGQTGPELGHIECVGVVGGQIGNDNDQRNLYTLRIEKPEIDFHDVFDQPRVHEAMDQLALRPDDPAARAELLDALREATPKQRVEDWTSTPFTVSTGKSRAAEGMNGTVTLADSRKVQIGNENMQVNKIIETRTPNINAAGLILRDPRLAARLLDAVVQPDAHNLRRLATAVDGSVTVQAAAMNTDAKRQTTVFRPPRSGRTLTVSGPGISVGKRARQRNRYRYEVDRIRRRDLDLPSR